MDKSLKNDLQHIQSPYLHKGLKFDVKEISMDLLLH